MARNVVPQPFEVDPAGLQHEGRIVVLGQREQEVFEMDLGVALLAGVISGAHQGGLKRWRHRNPIVHHSLHHTRCHPATIVPFGTQYRSFAAELQPTSGPQAVVERREAFKRPLQTKKCSPAGTAPFR